MASLPQRGDARKLRVEHTRNRGDSSVPIRVHPWLKQQP
jgi:hypothetical protein